MQLVTRTPAASANNATNLNNIASTNYARKDQTSVQSYLRPYP